MKDNSIQVLTESWKYENTLFEKFDLEAFKSFSRSITMIIIMILPLMNNLPTTASTYDRSIKEIQQIAKNDTSKTILNNYNYWINNSIEKESSYGINVKYKFRISNNISGNIKFGKNLGLKSNI